MACSKGSEDNPEQPENIIEHFEQRNMDFTEGAGKQIFSFTANTAWVVMVASTRNGEALGVRLPLQAGMLEAIP